MMRQNKLALAAVAASLFLSSAAFAQTKATAGGGGGGGKDEGYGYEFSDDPLSAGGFGPNDATIRVRPGPVRTTLIRPRTSFVPEMLKSVENL
jgi:opacity protein-like surface antigen